MTEDTALREPHPNREVAQRPPANVAAASAYDVVIVGGGPAGLPPPSRRFRRASRADDRAGSAGKPSRNQCPASRTIWVSDRTFRRELGVRALTAGQALRDRDCRCRAMCAPIEVEGECGSVCSGWTGAKCGGTAPILLAMGVSWRTLNARRGSRSGRARALLWCSAHRSPQRCMAKRSISSGAATLPGRRRCFFLAMPARSLCSFGPPLSRPGCHST